MASQTNAATLAAEFAAAVARGEPCYAGGAAAARFELSSFLQIATEDDGGMVGASLPVEGGVYAGDAARHDVQLPLATIITAAAAREGVGYAMQIPLDSTGPLRQAMARAAAAVVPPWAVAAKSAAVAAVEGGDASLQVWIGGNAPTTTTAHYDGLENMMIVTRGRKTVDLWPPACPKLARSAPAWAYRATVEPLRPTVTFTLDAGDCAYWPEGWWHRVRSDADTVAINVWWPGVRPQLDALPAPRAAFALRTLAHRCVELRLASVVADAAAYTVDDEFTRAEALRRGVLPPRLFLGPAVDALFVPFLADRYGRDAWLRALEAVDGRGAHVLEAVQGDAVLDALFWWSAGDAGARTRFDAKREEFCAAELRRAVCDACGVAR
jgi:mannose-6-phosphate isomerase-like protein (cupin superfamily)